MTRKGTASANSSIDGETINLAPEGSAGPSAERPTPGGKSIFLFADGTGNSSAKLFKTNVWRMYEAIDLGLASPGKRIQVAYYDNGVGTSSFRPLRMLGGIFGIGLKTNVLRIYAFLCRNYQQGDRIYAFGFSRGAFTIRLLVGLICSQGIIKAKDEATLAYQVRDAYRAFCAEHLPNRWIARQVATLFRWVRNGLVHAKRKLSGQRIYSETVRLHTKVEFVGVWDTVAAYGGPFAELTRGIDDWVWPLSMPHYGLSPKILKARHALALDDERDAFHPLLWDEVREQDMIVHGGRAIIRQEKNGEPVREILTVAEGRLRQVWFTGAHSDVGGGYPDESLSYISLLWMMDELTPDPSNPDVDFIDSFVQRAKDLANPYGPIHDSRSGLGAYYRYQPRKIQAMLDPVDHRTKSLRDPLISSGFTAELAARARDKTRNPKETPLDRLISSAVASLKSIAGSRALPVEHGLLKKVEVHESVIARVISGIDDYAPAALPKGFEIVTATGPFATPLLTTTDQDALKKARTKERLRAYLQENAWGMVWRRRVTYFATVGATLVLLTLPFHKYLDQVETLCSDDRCFAKGLVTTPIFFFPLSIRELVAQWAEKPLLVIFLLTLIAALVVRGKRLERSFRGRVRKIWTDYLARSLKPKAAPRGRKIRESFTYQDTLYLIKWHVLPFIFGLATLGALIFAGVSLLTQFAYAWVEPRENFCTSRTDDGGKPLVSIDFLTNDKCTDLKFDVEHNRLYVVDLKVDKPWKDDTLSADPERGVIDVPWHMHLLTPLKRVTSANWLEPLTEVRTHDIEGKFRKSLVPIIGPQIDIRRQRLLRMPVPNFYQGLLCPRRSGHLYMMVNDAAPLLDLGPYKNNHGSAAVGIRPVEGDIGRCDPDHVSALSREKTRNLLYKLALPSDAATPGTTATLPPVAPSR